MYPGTFENLKQWSANRGQNSGQTVQSGSVFSRFRSNCIPIISVSIRFCRREVNRKYKTTADFVVLVEVLAFTLWKSVTSVTLLMGGHVWGQIFVPQVTLIMCQHVAYLSQTVKENSESLLRLCCLEVLAFRQFLQVLLFVYARESRGHARLGLKLLPAY